MVLTAVWIGCVPSNLFATPKDRIGEKIEDVTLRTLEGEPTQLLAYHTEEVLVIAYTGVGCPIAQ